MARQALTMQRRVFGPEDRETVASLLNLSAWHADIGQHEEAAHLARYVLPMQRGVLGLEHPETLASHIQLSTFLAGLGSIRRQQT